MKPLRVLQRQRRVAVLALVVIAIFSSESRNYSTSAKSIGKETPAAANIRPFRIVDRFVKVDHLRVHYVESGAGRTVVMIHGNAGSVEDFELGALELLSSNYRVLAIDRPGHGRSDRHEARATVEDQAELLHRTLKELGVTKPILVGHSWGASLVLAYALKYQCEVSGVVLLAPAAYADDSGGRLLNKMIGTPIIGDLSLFLGRAFIGRRMLRQGLAQAFYPQQPTAGYIKMVSSMWLQRQQLRAYIEDEFSLNESLRKISKQYREIKVPVVIVTGDKDQIVSPERDARSLHAAIPQSCLIELKDTGHEIPQTHPETVDAAVRLISPVSAG